jgi:ABC-type multidrug transport system fused ATPase/permease subunit
MNSLQMIFKYWSLSRRDFWLALIFQLISIICALLPPIFIGRLVGSLDPHLSTPPTSLELGRNFVLTILFAFCTFLFGRFGRLRSAEVSSKAVYFLRNDINAALSIQSFAFFDKIETGQLIARITSDVDQTQMIFGFGLSAGIQSIIQVTGVIISASILSIDLAWVLYLGIPISLLASIIITRRLKPIFLRTREAFANLLTTIRENILGASVVRIFSTYKKERQKFQWNNDIFYQTSTESIKYNT